MDTNKIGKFVCLFMGLRENIALSNNRRLIIGDQRVLDLVVYLTKSVTINHCRVQTSCSGFHSI